MRRSCFASFFILLINFIAVAQSADSLELSFEKELDKEKKSFFAAKLVFEIYKTKGDLNKSDFYYKFAINNSDKNKSGRNAYVEALRNKGIIFYYTNDVDSAIYYFERSLKQANLVKDNFSICKNLNNIASVYYSRGELKKALSIYIDGAQKEKEFGFIEGEHISLNNIGYIYTSLKVYDKARYYFRKALTYCMKTNNKGSMIYTYDGLSTTYPNNSDSSNFYKFKAYNLAVELNDINNIMHSSNDIANYYLEKKDYENAAKYANECLLISNKLQNTALKAFIYNVLGHIALNRNQNKLALQYCDSITKYMNTEYSSYSIISLYRSISEIFERCKQPDSSLKYLQKAVKLNDTLYKTELTSTIAELQSKYDFTQKEKEIEELNRTNRQKQIIIYISIIIAAIIGFLTFNTLRISKKRKRLNHELHVVNVEMEEKNKIIEEKQKEILDSIHYAKRIQNTLLAHKEFLSQNLPEHFILFKPKDIVSGDFYWATSTGSATNQKFYLAVCDSTGHGVPGAFMSLLNIGFLSEAINEKGIEQPGDIFNHVRNRLINSVSKDGQQDGFDGILLCIDKANKTITYSAANNSPILISNNTLQELNSNRMPVGKGAHEETFVTHSINYLPGDKLYLYTDGFADQFGGPKGKKFKYRQLNDLLLGISDKLPTEQCEILDSEFSKWKSNLEQVDDVLIIGIKLI